MQPPIGLSLWLTSPYGQQCEHMNNRSAPTMRTIAPPETYKMSTSAEALTHGNAIMTTTSSTMAKANDRRLDVDPRAKVAQDAPMDGDVHDEVDDGHEGSDMSEIE